MNTNVLKGKWTEMKGEIRKAWGKLTEDELEKTHGDMTAIKGLIQQRYGHAHDDISQKLGRISDRYAENAKDSLRQSEKDRPH